MAKIKDKSKISLKYKSKGVRILIFTWLCGFVMAFNAKRVIIRILIFAWLCGLDGCMAAVQKDSAACLIMNETANYTDR